MSIDGALKNFIDLVIERSVRAMIDDFLTNDLPRDFPQVPKVTCGTVRDFFDGCVCRALPDATVIVAWHELLLQYADDPDAVFLSRLYEHQKLPDGRWDTRRCALTIMADGFSYAFASNYFARVIYTMAWCGFVPDYDDFKSWLVGRDAKLGYFMSTDVERVIAAYPLGHYATHYYTPGWYLAHNVAVNGDDYAGAEDLNIKDILTIGDRTDWRREGEMMVRRENKTLDLGAKSLARAHFLRFLDPINYFLVPSRKHARPHGLVGEDARVVNYMRKYAEQAYGDSLLSFYQNALVPRPMCGGDDLNTLGDAQFPFSFTTQPEPNSTAAEEGVMTTANDDDSSVAQTGLTQEIPEEAPQLLDEQVVRMARLYLEQGMSFRELERVVLHIDSQARGGGFVAKAALNAIGITANEKNLLSPLRGNPFAPARRAIADSTGQLHETLTMIYE